MEKSARIHVEGMLANLTPPYRLWASHWKGSTSRLSSEDSLQGTGPPEPALFRQSTIRRTPMKGALAWLIGIPIPIIIILYLLDVF